MHDLKIKSLNIDDRNQKVVCSLLPLYRCRRKTTSYQCQPPGKLKGTRNNNDHTEILHTAGHSIACGANPARENKKEEDATLTIQLLLWTELDVSLSKYCSLPCNRRIDK